MVKLYNAITKELDNAKDAVKEILGQLNIEKNMLKNTVGIIHYYNEFIDTGICKSIAAELPFEIVGCVSSYMNVNGEYAEIALSVTMITADDASFSVKLLKNLNSKTKEQIDAEIKEIFENQSETPKLVMPYLTPIVHFGNDEFVKTTNELPCYIPFFGTLAWSSEENNDQNNIFVNGEVFTDCFAFVIFHGNVNPKFHLKSSFSLDNEDDLKDTAEITDAESSTLKEINGENAVDYLKKLGMVSEDNKMIGWTVPAILTYPNGLKIVRGFIGIIEGTKYLFSTGYMTTGAKIKFAALDADKTIASAMKLAEEILDAKENDIFGYSCIARAWALGSKFYAEMEKITDSANKYQETTGKKINYCIAYSGGEICPICDNTGKMINVSHNYTHIACAFN